jgi:hypothetical protein
VFRDDLEQDSGLKANTKSAMQPNSFKVEPGHGVLDICIARRIFSRSEVQLF